MKRSKTQKPDQTTLPVVNPPRNVVQDARRTIEYHFAAMTNVVSEWTAAINDHQRPDPLSRWHLAHQIEVGTEDALKAIEFLRIVVPVIIDCASAMDVPFDVLRNKLTTAIRVWKEQALSGEAVRHSTSAMSNLRAQVHYLALLKAISMAEEALMELTYQSGKEE